MKITPKSHVTSNRSTQKKTSSSSHFGSVFSSELQAVEPRPSQQDTLNDKSEQASKEQQQVYPLVEQASELLSQALSQLEMDAKPNQETLRAIHDVRQQLEELTAQGHESRSIDQAKILLAVEAQRIQAMKR